MRARRSLLSTEDATRDLWPSFTDVTSTIALILFVLVLLAFVRNLVAGKKLDLFQRQIQASEQKLQQLGEDLERTHARIELGQKQLKLSEQKLEDQQKVLAESNRQLGELRTQLQGIAVLRVEVLRKVKTALEAELGTSDGGAPPVTIGDSGNILINESLVFDYNASAIKPQGKPLLQTLARALGSVLSDPNVRDNVDVILIQGHTDERGPSTFNRDLSARRASAVLNYMLEVNPVLEQSYGSYFAASAYSEFRPLNTARTEAAFEQNRRIEVAVVLKDAQVRKVIDDYMRQQAPAAP